MSNSHDHSPAINSILRKFRIIPRLDIKGSNLIKGVQLEGLRVIGDPAEFAKRYYEGGADELIYTDVVASLYGRNNHFDVVAKTASYIFVPMTVGGGMRSIEDVDQILRVGADKISVNTAAIRSPKLITESASQFGSQCCVVEIQARSCGTNQWTALYDSGREESGLKVIDWARQVEELGAGELLLTSVDRDGTRSGVDLDLVAAVSSSVNIPVIASGGVSSKEDAAGVSIKGGADAVAIGSLLHYGSETIREIKETAHSMGLGVRF